MKGSAAIRDRLPWRNCIFLYAFTVMAAFVHAEAVGVSDEVVRHVKQEGVLTEEKPVIKAEIVSLKGQGAVLEVLGEVWITTLDGGRKVIVRNQILKDGDLVQIKKGASLKILIGNREVIFSSRSEDRWFRFEI